MRASALTTSGSCRAMWRSQGNRIAADVHRCAAARLVVHADVGDWGRPDAEAGIDALDRTKDPRVVNLHRAQKDGVVASVERLDQY